MFRWSQLNRREQILIILVVIVVLPIAAYFYFYQPLQKKIKSNRQKLKQVKTNFKAEKALLNNRFKIQTRYQKTKQQLTSNNKLVTRQVISELIVELNQLADQNNLSLLALKPQEKQEIKAYFKYPVTLQVGGSYHDMLVYLEAIYQLDYLLRVEKIVLSSTSNSGIDNSQLTMGIKIAGYTTAETSNEGD